MIDQVPPEQGLPETEFEPLPSSRVERIRQGLVSALEVLVDNDTSTPQQDLEGTSEYAERYKAIMGKYGEFLLGPLEKKKEIVRAFNEFALGDLSVESIRNMNGKNRNDLALHFVTFIKGAQHRAKVLSTPGVDFEGKFRDYGYTSEEELIQYGHELGRFLDTVSGEPFYAYLKEQTYSSERTLFISAARRRRVTGDPYVHLASVGGTEKLVVEYPQRRMAKK